MALMVSVSARARWSSQRMTLRSELSALEKCGWVTETGWLVSDVKTAREQVASKPMPFTEVGGMREVVRMDRTQCVMARQMSVVDCSWWVG